MSKLRGTAVNIMYACIKMKSAKIYPINCFIDHGRVNQSLNTVS